MAAVKNGATVTFHFRQGDGTVQDCPAIVCNAHADGVTFDLVVFSWGSWGGGSHSNLTGTEGTSAGQFTR